MLSTCKPTPALNLGHAISLSSKNKKPEQKYSAGEIQWKRNTVEKYGGAGARVTGPWFTVSPFTGTPLRPTLSPLFLTAAKTLFPLKFFFFQTISNSADVSNCSIYLTKKSVFNNFLKFPAAQCCCRVAPLFKILLTLRLPDVSANSWDTVLQR